MTKSACMENAPIKKLLPKTVRPLNVKLLKLNTITVNENRIQHTVSVEEVTLVPSNVRKNNGSDKNNDMPAAKYRTRWDVSDIRENHVGERFQHSAKSDMSVQADDLQCNPMVRVQTKPRRCRSAKQYYLKISLLYIVSNEVERVPGSHWNNSEGYRV